MKLENIKELVKLIDKSGLTELNWSEGDTKLILKKGLDSSGSFGSQLQTIHQPIHQPQILVPQAQSSVSNAGAGETPKEAAKVNANNYHEVLSPMVGTLYLSPSPDEPAFVKVGDQVQKGQVICIIEAMKLMNEIESDASGQLMEIIHENESPVEYGTPIFRIKKS